MSLRSTGRRMLLLLLVLLSAKITFDLTKIERETLVVAAEVVAEAQEKNLMGKGALSMLKKSAENNTIFVTSGNWGFRDMLENVVLTSAKAYPNIKVVVVTLDEKTYNWCQREMVNSTCLSFNCSCPEKKLKDLTRNQVVKKTNITEGGYSQESGYTDCLIGIYVCKLRVKLRILELGFNLLFIDGDAAIRPGGLSQVTSKESLDVAGACEFCSGSCSISPAHSKVVDGGKNIPRTGYWQVNIGLFWVNNTITSVSAIRQSIDVIVENDLEFKSIDQTVLNRKLIALNANSFCVPNGGLNVKSRSARPLYAPASWGVHAARLVSKTGFYKRAFLHHNGLWEVRPLQPNFEEHYKQWVEHPKRLKKTMKEIGEIEY
eukprot:TRINITY_DN20585_c0_g1_i1.p1 TRINITY_DN20585_c0_g1~~TRINITY_DN20585_c0_g1_i1.p1  ORF type:complete len:375 (+),score=26.55 TRINITY_DN20585_c0_g1_i1:41-1165(+)